MLLLGSSVSLAGPGSAKRPRMGPACSQVKGVLPMGQQLPSRVHTCLIMWRPRLASA
jgi:hypothetical protein